jgi:hypothetical protein
MATKTKVDIEIDITPEMLAAGLQVLVDSGVLDQGAGRELPTGASEALVSDIYKAMARVRSTGATIQVTLPGVIDPGAELVVKNESDQPIRVVTDPHETLKLKVRDRPSLANGSDRPPPRPSRRLVMAHTGFETTSGS